MASAEEGGAAASEGAAPVYPRLPEIRTLIEELVKTTDHTELTIKGIRAQLKERIDAEDKRDYDKGWLRTQVDECLAAERADTAAASTPEAAPEPAAAESEADAARAEPPPPKKKAAPKKAAPKKAAPPDPDSQVAKFGLGTVLWAKLQGYPFWPAMVIKPNVTQRKKAGGGGGGMVFVKFFDTHDFAFCETLLPWDEGVAQKLPSKQLSKKYQKSYVAAVKEAEAEIANPTPMQEDEEEEEVVEDEEDDDNVEEEEEEAAAAAAAKQPAGVAPDSSDDEAAPKPTAPKPKPKAKPAPPPKKKNTITADSSDDDEPEITYPPAAAAAGEDAVEEEEEEEEEESEEEEEAEEAEEKKDDDFKGGAADSSEEEEEEDGEFETPLQRSLKRQNAKGEAAGKKPRVSKGKAARASTAAGGKGRPPRWTTAPRQPAWCLPGRRPLLRSPERRLSSWQARRGLEPASGRPKVDAAHAPTRHRRAQEELERVHALLDGDARGGQGGEPRADAGRGGQGARSQVQGAVGGGEGALAAEGRRGQGAPRAPRAPRRPVRPVLPRALLPGRFPPCSHRARRAAARRGTSESWPSSTARAA